RLRPAPPSPTPSGRRLSYAVAAAFVVFAALPLGVIAAVPRLHDGGRLAVRPNLQTLIPVSPSVGLHAAAADGVVRLRWSGSEPGTASGFYHVLRRKGAPDVACAGRVNDSSNDCSLFTDSLTTTPGTSFTDRPGAGTWTYRIGVAA